MTSHRAVQTTAMNQEVNEQMRELIEACMHAPPANGPLSVSQHGANSTPSIRPIVPSDVNTLLERMSDLSLAEMDRSIQELQKARNFLRNERERMRQEMAEYLRLTQTAMGSAKAVSTSIESFGTAVNEVGKNRTA
jgi:hypothetical protein